MRLKKSAVLLVAATYVAATPASAADEDGNFWLAGTANVNVSEKLFLMLEGQARWTDDAEKLGQYLVRPSVSWKLGPNTSAAIGYAYVHTDPPGPAQSDEHRAWQQLSFRVAGDGKGVTLVGRTRLEQRWVERRPDMGWRLRQQLRATAPLTGKVRGVVWSEAFLSLDDTRWGQRRGLDRWRNAVGLAIPVSKAVTVEPSYINQWVVRSGDDRVNHIANISLSARF